MRDPMSAVRMRGCLIELFNKGEPLHTLATMRRVAAAGGLEELAEIWISSFHKTVG